MQAVKTNTPKIPEAVTINDNLLIKGNNLLALYSLRKKYAGKIKLIYIDPPYNTGNDGFRYNDSFNHSSWLTFMKNRLEVARELLSDNGFIAIHIDNKELHYLKILCDEVLQKDNFRNAIVVKKGTKNLQKQFDTIQKLNAGYDTILLYSKLPEYRMSNLFKTLDENKPSMWNNHWRGTDRPSMRFEIFGIKPETGQWRWEKNRTFKAIENYKKFVAYILEKENLTIDKITDNHIDLFYDKYLSEFGFENSDFELVRLSKNNKPEHYIPEDNQILLNENWLDLSVAGGNTYFEHEKNENILLRLLKWITKPNDIVLDFFSGSGTTPAVAHKMGRRWIAIEQMDYIKDLPEARLKKVIEGEQGGISKAVNWQGGGSFVYCELAKWNENWLQKIRHSTNTEQLINIYDSIVDNGFLNFKIDFKKFDMDTFKALDFKKQQEIMCSLLNKNHLYVNYSERDDTQYQISDSDKRLSEIFYGG